MLHIVHTLLAGPRGFNELGREVGGCNPTTLAQRLARLEELGLVHRLECDGGRSAYSLTAAGTALREVIDAIHAWSQAHLGEDGIAHNLVVEVPKLEPARVTHPAVEAAVAPSRPVVHRSRSRKNEERAEPRASAAGAVSPPKSG